MRQFLSSTFDIKDVGTSKNQQIPDVEGFLNITKLARPKRTVTGDMVSKRLR
jgi:hypothetical protein